MRLQRAYSTVIQTKKTTILDIKNKFLNKQKITMVTSYDYTSALFVDEAGIDISLVGDSLGMVMLGQENSVSVTMDEMILHAKSVSRGSKNAFLIGDMPYGSYEESPQLAIRNAIRFLKEGKMEGVKIESDKSMADTVRAVVKAGVPVMGHIGLTPQRINYFGGFKVQGRTVDHAKEILEDALALQDAGCFSIVIEAVPEPVGKYITEKLKIPTIGIGAGKYTSGQVLVYHDILGLYPNLTPKFCKQYVNLKPMIVNALRDYKNEVENESFPSEENVYKMKQGEKEKLEEKE